MLKTILILTLGSTLASTCFAGDSDQTVQHRESAPMVLAQEAVRGLGFDVYIRLHTGMSEGELLLRAGKPDSESVENFRDYIVKTYYYYPTVSNPWISAITLRGGRITHLERTKKSF